MRPEELRPLLGGSTEQANDSKKKLTVESIDNHIYFYSEVDPDRCLALIKAVRELDAKLRSERESRSLAKGASVTPIWLHIHSLGGDLFSALAAADTLAAIAEPVYSVIEGACASAATFLSLPCAKRYITPGSYVMIHQFWSAMWGKYEEFKDEMVLYDMLINRMVDFYAKHTKLRRPAVRRLLKRDSWFSAEQCVDNGLADEIWQGRKTGA